MAEKDKFNSTILCSQLKRIAKSNNQKSWSTKRTYMAELNKLCRDLYIKFQVQKIENIKNIHIKSLIEDYIDKGTSIAEIKKRLAALRWAINYQQAWLYSKNSKKRCRFTLTNKELGLGQKQFKQRYGIDYDSFCTLLNVMSKHSNAKVNRNIAKLQYYFGLRSREAVLMNSRTLSNALDTRTLIIKEGAKGGRTRKLTLDKKQIAVIREILTDMAPKHKDDYLFVDKSIKGNVASRLKSYQCFYYNHRHELPCTLNPHEYEHISSHTLRRSFASNQLIKYRKRYDEKVAREKVITDLGHGKHRTELLKCYCGGVM